MEEDQGKTHAEKEDMLQQSGEVRKTELKGKKLLSFVACVSAYVCMQKGGEAEEEKKVVGEKGKSNESSAIFFFFFF